MTVSVRYEIKGFLQWPATTSGVIIVGTSAACRESLSETCPFQIPLYRAQTDHPELLPVGPHTVVQADIAFKRIR